MHPQKNSALGFSLIEIIVIVVIAGLLGALVVSMLSSQLTRSGLPLLTARNAASAEACMENVVANFTTAINYNNNTDALATVKNMYNGNTTVGCVNNTYDTVPVLIVTVTVNDTSLTTVFAQERNSTDASVTY